MFKSIDIPRYVLFALIAAFSYLLLTEWVSFQDAQKAQQKSSVESSESMPVFNEVASASENLPDAASIPSAPAAINQAALPAEEKAADQTKLIRVKTDVLEVAIDRQGGDIVYAALPKHFAAIDTPDQPFVVLEQNSQRTYIAQSGLIGANGTDSAKGRPLFSSEQQFYELAPDQDQLTVTLSFIDSYGAEIKKVFTFKRDVYLIDVNYHIANQSSQPWSASYFAQIKRDNTEAPSVSSSGFGMQPYLGTALHTDEEPFVKLSFKDIAKKPLNENYVGGWIAMIQHYFISAWVADPEQKHNFSTVKTANGNNIIRYTTASIQLAPGEQGSFKSSFYVGPKDQYKLEAISPGLELSVDYGWLWWIAQPLFWLLTKIYQYVGNWGWAIIFLTVLVKAAFFQLNATAYKSMANMRKMQPKIMDIRERYANDKQKQSQEMMALYKKEKINPLGGCLPILVQMPVFIALYWVLMESVELRHAPFMAWIDDLSVMDPYFVLPLIMGLSMFIQQKLNPAPPDPMQAKVMQWMPVIFTFFFLFFPAGLVLYWVVNNTLSIIQQYVITKRIEKNAK